MAANHEGVIRKAAVPLHPSQDPPSHHYRHQMEENRRCTSQLILTQSFVWHTLLSGPGFRLQPPDPEGTSPVGSPRRISRRVPLPLGGLEGSIQAAQRL